MNIRIRCFHSENQKEVTKIYFSGQADIFNEFGVNAVFSSASTAWQDKNTYLLLLEDVTTGIIGGGMRIDVATPDRELPLEKALKNQYPEISSQIHKLGHHHLISETCGLWIKKEFKTQTPLF